MKKSIEGELVFLRTNEDCFCCRGNHVMAVFVDVKQDTEGHDGGLSLKNIEHFFKDALRKAEELDRKKVRITVDVVGLEE